MLVVEKDDDNCDDDDDVYYNLGSNCRLLAGVFGALLLAECWGCDPKKNYDNDDDCIDEYDDAVILISTYR